MSNSFKNILFRADSSSSIGTGHIMRDLVLAKQYPKATITFATQDLDGNINHKISEAGYKLEILNSNDLKELDNLIKQLSIDTIIIDHYDIDWKYEKQLSTLNFQLSIMALDDTYEKHHCDILINHNISADKKKYKGLVPKDCELRCGSKYTLIRDEFKEERNKKSIFLAMGGADSENISLKVLKVLSSFKNIQTNLVTTTANPNIKRLQQYIKKHNNIKLFINSNKLAKLMKQSDLAIVSPSVIVHEILYMQLPFIAIKTADNQNDIYKYLLKNKYLVLQKFNKKELNLHINKIIGEINNVI